MINFQFFPRSHGVTPEIQVVIDCFKKIEATLADGQHRVSNDVLALLRPHLEACGYDVEKGKGRDEKIDVPVLFARCLQVPIASRHILRCLVSRVRYHIVTIITIYFKCEPWCSYKMIFDIGYHSTNCICVVYILIIKVN